MRAYLITTAVLFGLLTVAHVLRVFAEGPQLAKSVWYVLITVATAALCVWAVLLLRQKPLPRR